jgi:hypothetical protein
MLQGIHKEPAGLRERLRCPSPMLSKKEMGI